MKSISTGFCPTKVTIGVWINESDPVIPATFRPLPGSFSGCSPDDILSTNLAPRQMPCIWATHTCCNYLVTDPDELDALAFWPAGFVDKYCGPKQMSWPGKVAHLLKVVLPWVGWCILILLALKQVVPQRPWFLLPLWGRLKSRQRF